jgi:hypothetical protein
MRCCLLLARRGYRPDAKLKNAGEAVTAVTSERSYLRRPRLCRMPAMAGELWQHASEDSERACQRRHESGRAGESGSASRPEALGRRHARATE